MNNFQNDWTGKLVSPPENVADYNETCGSDQRKEKQEAGNREKLDKTRTSGALKIFYESKNFNVNEPRSEWNFKSVKKKSCKDVTQKGVAEEKKKSRKNWKKIQKRDNSKETISNEPNYFTVLESQLTKAKAVGTAKFNRKPETQFSKHLFNTSEFTKICELSEKRVTKAEPEKETLKSLFTSQRPNTNTGSKPEKQETAVKPKKSTLSSCQNLSRKNSEKGPSKSSDLKTTISDYSKRHINEILKNHAQKVQGTPTKNLHIKECPIRKVSDLFHSTPNTPGTNGASQLKAEKVTLPKGDIRHEKSQESNAAEATGKTPEPTGKDTRKAKGNVYNEGDNEDKKKLPTTWLSFPQSNELERRLKGSWQEPRSLFFNDKNLKSSESSEEEKQSRKLENYQQEEEQKSEKRATYTDRLLLLKMVSKTLEDQKQRMATEVNRQDVNQQKTPNKEKQEYLAKKIENLVSPHELKSLSVSTVKDVTFSDNKELPFLKDKKFPDTEQILKTKQTRSTELRDLVAQAIKEHKIFCIFDNHTYIVKPVREELLSRGWLEVIPDRRLIPRRRPPPMGPTYERDKTAAERNCNTLEAILTAKENFADEIQETVSKSPSFRLTIEKPLPITAPFSTAAKKCSENSLTEVLSQFRIIPPTTEKKKNNSEIREFMAKYQAILQNEKEREKEIKKLKEKEKNAKIQKKEKTKQSLQNSFQKNKSEGKPRSPEEWSSPLPSTKSLQAILNSIHDNKQLIMHAALEIKNFESERGAKVPIGVLYDSTEKTTPPAIKDKRSQENKDNQDKPLANSTKIFFSDSEAKTISKIIQSSNARIHFMWLSIKPAIHLKCFNYSPEIINKFQKTTFCTKIGLWSHLNNIQWYAHEVNYPAKSPRMYNTGEAEDLQAFFQDFQLTACIGLLKWLSDTFFEKGLKAVQTKKGKVPLKAFEFAIKQCEKYIKFKDNEDLSTHDEPKVHEDEWNSFLQWFYIITNDHGKIQESSSAQLMVLYTKAVETLKMMRRHWPEIDIDGRLNIWIMKPYCASCGRGIFMTNNVYYIGQHTKYIVQKYIEKPLLIYNTKFDIRQWFMITKLTPLEIWMYKECYLRFCTQPFALRNLHESVHLSNNSVQRKYISFRDPNLPDQNMWDSNTFQLYLKTIGYPTIWDDIIYPGMRDAIVSTMLAAQDTFDGPRKSWFEVYGADFMLSANLKEGPWLIEINENPAMDPSTKVTARLCPQMLRDVIKVVVDKRSNKNASTGQWELIYRQNYSPSFGTVDMDVRGKKIAKISHPQKVSLNIPLNLSTSPISVKKYSSEEVGPQRLNQAVKKFKATQTSKKDINNFEKPRHRKKTRRNVKSINQLKTKNEIHTQNVCVNAKSKHKKMNEETKEAKNANENIAHVENRKSDSKNIFKLNKNSRESTVEHKNSLTVVSSTGGLNSLSNNSSRKLPKQSTRSTTLTETKENISFFNYQFQTGKTERTDAKNQSNFQTEKYKFTKYYKV